MEMRWGVVAFIDVLGFKGIWKREQEPEDILGALTLVKTKAEELSRRQNESDGGDLWSELSITVRAISDTIVVTCYLPDGKEDLKELEWYEGIRRYMLLRYIVLILTNLVTEAACGKVPLLYRGCIASGLFAANEFATLGPAVDEAGALFEAAQGYFVLLAPSAAGVYRQRPGLLSRAVFPYFVQYDVPVKEGSILRTFVLNPLLFVHEKARGKLKERIVASFGTGPLPSELETKRKNTEEFLNCIEGGWLGGWTGEYTP